MYRCTVGFLRPVTNIDSSIDNCSTIDITWTAPTVDDRVSIQYYILRIYDAITGSLVDTVSVYDTSYQFVDNDLFIHRYTYVITGVNELGKGISNNDTFSYQRSTFTFFILMFITLLQYLELYRTHHLTYSLIHKMWLLSSSIFPKYVIIVNLLASPPRGIGSRFVCLSFIHSL